MFANSAERFWRDAKVRSDHPLGHLGRDARVSLQKLHLTLLGRHAQGVDDASVFRSGVPLERHTEHRRKSREGFNHSLVRNLIEQEQAGALHSVDGTFTD
jgi:hypothetical protein